MKSLMKSWNLSPDPKLHNAYTSTTDWPKIQCGVQCKVKYLISESGLTQHVLYMFSVGLYMNVFIQKYLPTVFRMSLGYTLYWFYRRQEGERPKIYERFNWTSPGHYCPLYYRKYNEFMRNRMWLNCICHHSPLLKKTCHKWHDNSRSWVENEGQLEVIKEFQYIEHEFQAFNNSVSLN